MDKITPQDVINALAVISIVMAFFVGVWKFVEAMQKLTKADQRKAAEAAQNAAIADLNKRMTQCEERLARGDARFDENRADMTQILNVMNAMLMHFISGNDHEKLRDVKKELDTYMAVR